MFDVEEYSFAMKKEAADSSETSVATKILEVIIFYKYSLLSHRCSHFTHESCFSNRVHKCVFVIVPFGSCTRAQRFVKSKICLCSVAVE